MKRNTYNVTLFYYTSIEIEVVAENKANAIENARQMAARDDQEIVDTLLGGLIEYGEPYVEQPN